MGQCRILAQLLQCAQRLALDRSRTAVEGQRGLFDRQFVEVPQYDARPLAGRQSGEGLGDHEAVLQNAERIGTVLLTREVGVTADHLLTRLPAQTVHGRRDDHLPGVRTDTALALDPAPDPVQPDQGFLGRILGPPPVSAQQVRGSAQSVSLMAHEVDIILFVGAFHASSSTLLAPNALPAGIGCTMRHTFFRG
jgi:hypothetical protein